ncbi:MAG: kelch repeat-containing protein [Planctomycetota bacterium]
MNDSTPAMILRTALLFPLLATSLLAQVPSPWTQLAVAGPGARDRQAMVYDALRDRTVLFGGGAAAGASASYFADTWEWDGAAWTPVATAGPSARWAHGMTADGQRGRIVLFGGYDGAPLGDTWEYDGAAWTQVATTGPAPRLSMAMAYDTGRGRTVLVGGSAAIAQTYFGDTWEWDGGQWSQLAVAGPSPRYGAAMAHDGQRGRTVLFGGLAAGTYLGDTWQWDGSTWVPMGGAGGPPGRFEATMAFDGQRGRSILFGGRSAAGYLGDTWAWDGATWALVANSGPSARQAGKVAYDGHRGETLLFGGWAGGTNYLADTWRLPSDDLVPASAAVFGTGCGSPALQLDADANARPIVGSTARAIVSNAPGVAFGLLGASNTALGGAVPLPLDLAVYGAPGCFLATDGLFGSLWPTVVTGAGQANFEVAIPGSLALLGLPLFAQAWSPAPGANAAGLVLSNGVAWVVGSH